MSEKKTVRRNVAFISSLLGFLLVWNTVLSSVLVSNSIEHNSNAANTRKLLNTHQDVGRIIFALGHEMVSTVDWLLTNSDLQKETKRDLNTISITWNMSNNVIDTVRQNAASRWIRGTDTVIPLITSKLIAFREQWREGINPIDVIHFYLDLCQQMHLKWELTQKQLTDSFYIPLSFISYNLFNEGMAKRFAEISLGTVYFKSSLPLNRSEYFDLHYSSRNLLESAFSFNRKGQQRYWELLSRDPQTIKVLSIIGEDILAGSLDRSSPQLAIAYIETVKEEIAMLLLAKDILNATLAVEVKHISASKQSAFLFHLSLAIIALLAVVICLFLICFSYKDIGNVMPQKTEAKTAASKENIYSLTIDEKAIFLAPNLYRKPHCYL